MKTHKQVKEEALKNPEIKKEYDALEAEFGERRKKLMSDRVQALDKGLHSILSDLSYESAMCDPDFRYDYVLEAQKKLKSFLASQELGWAEKSHRIAKFPFSTNEAIYLLKGLRAGLDMPLMTPEYQALTALIDMIDEGAVKFVPLEIGDETSI